MHGQAASERRKRPQHPGLPGGMHGAQGGDGAKSGQDPGAEIHRRSRLPDPQHIGKASWAPQVPNQQPGARQQRRQGGLKSGAAQGGGVRRGGQMVRQAGQSEGGAGDAAEKEIGGDLPFPGGALQVGNAVVGLGGCGARTSAIAGGALAGAGHRGMRKASGLGGTVHATSFSVSAGWRRPAPSRPKLAANAKPATAAMATAVSAVQA